MKSTATYLILISLIIVGCYGISKPENSSVETVERNIDETIVILNELIEIIGDSDDSLIVKDKKSIQNENISDGYFNVSMNDENHIVVKINADFHFTSDSISHLKFNAIREWMDVKYGKNSGSSKFCTWEIPSKRSYVSKVLLTNKSTFYQQPVIEIKIIEDDNRVYRK